MAKKLTIGVLINNLDSEYQRNIWGGVADVAHDLGLDVIFMGSGSISSPNLDDIRRNGIHDFIQPDSFDGLIIVSTTISGYVGIDAGHGFHRAIRRGRVFDSFAGDVA